MSEHNEDWHNLIQTPDDLPPESERVLVQFYSAEYNDTFCVMGDYSIKHKKFFVDDFGGTLLHYTPVAWKYVNLLHFGNREEK